MILIEGTEPLLPGDYFEMNWIDWDRISRPPMGPYAVTKRSKKIICKVLKSFIRSPYEIRYICVSTEDAHKREFVLGQILEPSYQVLVTSNLKVSALVFTEASGKLNLRSISPLFPTAFTKENADKMAEYIKTMELEEKHGYLVPKTE